MRIFHPQPELGRQSKFDVEFVDGVAAVESLHPERELAFRQHGYRIEADIDVEAPFHEGLGEPIIDLETLTKAELRGMLPDSVEVPAKASHADLVKLVSELPADPIPGSIDNGDGTFTTVGFPDGSSALVDGETIVAIVETETED